MTQAADLDFDDAVRGLMNGDFSRLEPLFRAAADGSRPRILDWHEAGRFAREPAVLSEAFTCACFNGCIAIVDYLLARGADPSGGDATGLNAVHWAANRGHLDVVDRLIRAGAPLETKNSYGGTALGCAVWSAVNEPRPGQLPVIARLLAAGADVRASGYPTHDAGIDDVIAPFAAP